MDNKELDNLDNNQQNNDTPETGIRTDSSENFTEEQNHLVGKYNEAMSGVYSGQRYQYSTQNTGYSNRNSGYEQNNGSSTFYNRSENQNYYRPDGNYSKPKKTGLGWKLFAAAILVAVFGAAAAGTTYVVNYFKAGEFPKASARVAESNREALTEGEVNVAEEVVPAAESKEEISVPSVMDVTAVVEAVMPSAVSITGNYTVSQQGFFGQIYQQQIPGSGSGIILSENDKQLLIATNNHVVEGSNDLEVQFIDGSTAKARIKGTDADMDLAVIVVDLEDLEKSTKDEIAVARLGDSNNLKIGEPAIAIGNSLGYGQTVTTGVISALDRSFESSETGNKIEGLIQTDAAINPGNSGGALVNVYGEVIGINSSKIGGTTIDGVGFAIPISSAEPILNGIVTNADRIKTMANNRGYFGIGGVSVTKEASEMYGMPVGVQVREIYPGTGSAESELLVGDIICRLNSTKITSMEDLQEELSYHEIDEVVKVTVYRFAEGEYVERSFDIRLSDKSLIGQ